MTSICQPRRLRRAFSAAVLSCGLLIGLGGIAGCMQHAATADQSAPSGDQMVALRESISKNNPGSMVGQVVLTLPTDTGSLAAVKDIPIAQVKIGDVVTFTDAQGTPVGNGTIIRIEDDLLNVRFTAVGTRGVMKGDAAIVLKDVPTTQSTKTE